jgi:hypothetical protein
MTLPGGEKKARGGCCGVTENNIFIITPFSEERREKRLKMIRAINIFIFFISNIVGFPPLLPGLMMMTIEIET